jgi:hypothetical protein
LQASTSLIFTGEKEERRKETSPSSWTFTLEKAESFSAGCGKTKKGNGKLWTQRFVQVGT